MLEPGATIGRYRVESLIGEGDLASTWKVAAGGDVFALRMLTVRDHGFGERLRRASAAQQNVDHPNLLRVIDVVESDGCPGVVTEYVDGTDLESWIASGPHGPTEVLRLFEQMVEGVRAAHAAGLLHRNLKPSKVLVGRVGTGPPRVRIADFLLGKVRNTGSGNAAVTQLGTTFGTPQYMSPEQFRGAATVDERSDLFSLGCLLYEMATGQRAFDGDNLLEVYQQVAACKFRPVNQVRPDLPPWVGELVDGLLTPEPASRYASAAALLERIRNIRPAPMPSTPPIAAMAPPAHQVAQQAAPRKPAAPDSRAPTPPPVKSTVPASAPPKPTPPKPAPPKPAPAPPKAAPLKVAPSGQRPPPPPALSPDKRPISEDPDLIGEEYLRPRRPTALLVFAALLIGLTVGLGLVVSVALAIAWYLGAL